MWSSLAALLLIAFLPGALIYRLPWLDRRQRASLPAEERWFWAVIISCVSASLVTLGLAAIGRYTFERLLVASAVLCGVALLAGGRRLRYGGEARRPGIAAVVPFALAAVGVWLYLPPSEYVIAGKDPGTYMNEGIQIAQRGALLIHDPVVASVPEPARDLFFPSHENPSYYGIRFMGFFILDPASGTVVGQFPHLFPAWVAIGYGLNGLSGARQAVVAWAVLSLVSLYLVGARLSGRVAAAAAAGLLAVHVVMVWFARYPNAEVVMGALLLAALLAFGRAHVEGDRFFAPIAGLLLGLLLFLRFDAVLALAGVAAAVFLLFSQGGRTSLLFVAPLAVTCAAALAYLIGWMTPYAAYPFGFIRNLRWWHLAVLGCTAVGTLAAALLGPREPWAGRIRRWTPRALAGAVLAAAAYAYFFRLPTGRTAVHDAIAFRQFGEFYLTPPALLGAVAGFCFVVWRRFWRAPALLITTAIFGGFFFYKIRIVPDHFWMARRFLPVVLPIALLSLCALLFAPLNGRDSTDPALAGRPRGRLRLWALGLPLVLVGLLGAHYRAQALPVLHHVEYAGVIPRLEELAARFGSDDLVLVESRNASDVHMLGLPLAYIYARNVLVLNTPRPDHAQFRAFLEWAKDEYADVYFIGGGGTELLSTTIAVEAVGSERFQVPEFESARNAYPAGTRHKEFDFGIYRFVEPRKVPGSWFTLDVGVLDDLHVVRTHAKEVTAGRTFRWTRDVSYVSVLGIQPDSRIVTLWLNDGGRPQSVPPADVRVSLNDVPLGTAVVGHEFRPYTFSIPPDLAEATARRTEPSRLKIEVETWNPKTALGVPDDRELGVMLDRVEIR